MARPQITPAIAAAEAQKLLPHPQIASEPAAFTLVNLETPIWVTTTPDITLGTVTLLGYRITLRAHLQRVNWNFGDNSIATTTSPGKRYTDSDPCNTVQCSQYYGRTYTRTGTMTITAQLTWSGQFQVNGAHWQNIAGTVTAPATATRVIVKQARGILVQDPPH